jgi:hypothetical protein
MYFICTVVDIMIDLLSLHDLCLLRSYGPDSDIIRDIKQFKHAYVANSARIGQQQGLKARNRICDTKWWSGLSMHSNDEQEALLTYVFDNSLALLPPCMNIFGTNHLKFSTTSRTGSPYGGPLIKSGPICKRT